MGPAASASANLRGGRPETPVLEARELAVFGAIEVGHLRLHAGEVELLPFDGHLVNVHLGVPNHAVQRRNGRTHGGIRITGAVDVMPAGTPAYFRMEAASEHACMLIADRFVRRVAREAGADPDSFEVAPFFDAPDPHIERVGMSLLSEMKTRGLGGELFAESLANVLALHLLRSHSSLGRASRRRVGSEGGGYSGRSLGRATDYINDNLSRKLTLAEIAGAARMSPHHFARSFKKDTGLSPHRYVVQRRVERAKALLANTDLTVFEVAKAVGFANHSHLSSHVRRLLGVSPGALRRDGAR